MQTNRLLSIVGLSFIILLYISGCPPVWKQRVHFEQAGRRHEKLKLQGANGKVSLEIHTNGGYSRGLYELYLQTDISSDYLIEELTIRPESILINIGEVQLTKKMIMGGDISSPKENKHFYSRSFHFNCPMEKVRTELSISKSNKLKFVFDKFIKHGNTPILFDTVYAVDTGELLEILDELDQQ